MRQESWKWLFTWDGRVQRGPYFLVGTTLTLLKYAIDASVAARFGETWRIWNYFFPPLEVSLSELGFRQPKLYAILWAIAIPFFWVGIALTLRRLRDAGCRAGWIFLFFVPVVNLMLFLWLTVAPSTTKPIAEAVAADELRRIAKPRQEVLGVVIAVVLGFALATWGTQVLAVYSWGLFLGVPFLTGFVASWFLNVKGIRSPLHTIVISALTTLLIGVAFLSLGREGLICLLMAVPLALPFSIAGGLVARTILQRRSRPVAPPSFAACVAILPLMLMMFAEHAANPEPPVLSVTTSITIDAPVSSRCGKTLLPSRHWRLRKNGCSEPASPIQLRGRSWERVPEPFVIAISRPAISSSRSPYGTKTACSPSTSRPRRPPCES
jgi:uncharacterized membrane protein YhaH (DUF805 family)